MASGEMEILLMFARELREIVESFEEEAEILANTEIVSEIRESEEAYKKGEMREFRSIQDLEKEIGL